MNAEGRPSAGGPGMGAEIARGSELVIRDHPAGSIHLSLGPGNYPGVARIGGRTTPVYRVGGSFAENPLIFRPDPFLERGVGAQGREIRVAVGDTPCAEPLLGCLPQQTDGTSAFAQEPRDACTPV